LRQGISAAEQDQPADPVQIERLPKTRRREEKEEKEGKKKRKEKNNAKC